MQIIGYTILAFVLIVAFFCILIGNEKMTKVVLISTILLPVTYALSGLLHLSAQICTSVSCTLRTRNALQITSFLSSGEPTILTLVIIIGFVSLLKRLHLHVSYTNRGGSSEMMATILLILGIMMSILSLGGLIVSGISIFDLPEISKISFHLTSIATPYGIALLLPISVFLQ